MTDEDKKRLMQKIDAEVLKVGESDYMYKKLENCIAKFEETKAMWITSPIDGNLHCSECDFMLWHHAITALGGIPVACPYCGKRIIKEEERK
jgi:hypothetical protein